MKFSTNTIFTVVAVLIVAAGAYWYFFAGQSQQAPLTATTATGAAAPSAAETQFETLVGELGPITFDTSIFSDPRFAALVDISTPVTPEPSGRSDPFAPLSGSGSSVSATTATGE